MLWTILLVLVVLALVVLGLGLLVFQMRKRGGILSQPQLSPSEEKAVMAYPHDGITDIYVGLSIMMFGSAMFAGMPWLAGALIATWVPLWQSSKRTYTGPRISQVEFTPTRRGGARIILVILAILGGLAFLAGLLVFGLTNAGGAPTWLRAVIGTYGMVTAGVVGATLWCIAAFFNEVARFYVYAALTIGGTVLAYLSGIRFPLVVTLLGLIIFVAGLIILRQFVRRYPKAG